MAYNTIVKQQQLPVKTYDLNTGTWTFTQSSGIYYASKTAAAETTVVSIPIAIPRLDNQYGIRLKSINIPVRVGTADLSSAPTITLYQQNLGVPTNATPANITATTIPSTNNAVVTNNAADRLWTVTVTTPTLENAAGAVPDQSYLLVLSIPCATTTALRVYDATAIYESIEM